MFCTSCGNQIPVGTASCPSCGAPASAPAPAPQPAQPFPASSGPPVFAPSPGYGYAPPPAKSSKLPWILVAVLGCFGLLFVGGIFAAILLPALAAARGASRATTCKNNLKQIGVYCALYESKYRADPPSLKALYAQDLATDPAMFVCPVEGARPGLTTGMPWDSFASRISYEYRAPPRSKYPDINPDYVIAWDKVPHQSGGRAVLYYGGRVEELNEHAFENARAVMP